MAHKTETSYWEVRYGDGLVKMYESAIKPTGVAVKFLNVERVKGRDHISLQSVREISEELYVQHKVQGMIKHVQEHAGKNGATGEDIASIAEEEMDIAEEIIIDVQKDNELYKLIQQAISDTEKVEKLLYKFYEFTQDSDETYDNLFLLEFIKRVRRSLYVVDSDLTPIEKNLEG